MPAEPGLSATIPKGTLINGTFPGPDKRAGRTYTVKVHSIDAGYVPNTPWDGRHGVGRHAEVCWVGTGGYWHYAALEDVDLVGADKPDGYVTREAVAAAITDLRPSDGWY